MYRVSFEFLNELGEWKATDLSNNGKGFTYRAAEEIAGDLRQRGAGSIQHRNIKIEEFKPINTKLSLSGCWKMVNAIQNGKTPTDIRKRAAIAEEWLRANEVIDYDQYNELMKATAYLYRESYRIE